jgi:hypothetical protein
LSWKILEHKFRYYCGAEYGIKPVPDEVYDEVEEKYKKLSKILKLEPSAYNMVGFDFDKPSCRLVAERLITQEGKKKR